MFDFLKRRRHKATLRAIKAEYLATIREKADFLAKQQLGDLLQREETDPKLSSFLAAEDRTNLLLSIEYQFLWGVFSAYAAKHDWPTSAEDRTTLHLIDYLMNVRQQDFATARAEALDVRELDQEEEPLFIAISNLGRQAYEGVESPFFYRVLKASFEELEE